MGKPLDHALQPSPSAAAIKNDFTPLNADLMATRGYPTIFNLARHRCENADQLT
jgi:hypothetical protein